MTLSGLLQLGYAVVVSYKRESESVVVGNLSISLETIIELGETYLVLRGTNSEVRIYFLLDIFNVSADKLMKSLYFHTNLLMVSFIRPPNSTMSPQSWSRCQEKFFLVLCLTLMWWWVSPGLVGSRGYFVRSYLILFISLVKSYTHAHISNCKWFDLHDYCSHIFASFHSDVLMFINLFILEKKII